MNKRDVDECRRPRLKKKPIGFLDLAAELRNQIYFDYFQDRFFCEFAGKEAQLGQKQRKSIKIYRAKAKFSEIGTGERNTAPLATVRFSRVLGQYKRIQGLDTRWSSSLTGLIYVCKQVHIETIGLLYQNTTFGFDSPNRIRGLLTVLPKANLKNITRIQLHYHTYGEPKESKDVQWKQKHADSWSRACKSAAKQLVNLQHVELWVHLSDTSVQLDVRESYMKPILWFRKLQDPTKTIAKTLRTVSVHIDTIWVRPNAFVDQRLCFASRHLHFLFEKALGRILLGETLDLAMADFNEAWDIDYDRWHDHLQFVRAGW